VKLRERIINSAYELFSGKGYEQTTIEDIVQQTGCSKGGFYYHFQSKEEILEVIINNYISELEMYYGQIVSDERAAFLDRFNAVFRVISQYKLKQLIEWPKVNNVFAFAGNDRILRQLEKQFKTVTTGAYSAIIRKGKVQGAVKTEHPEILAELCTREILWIFEAAVKLVLHNDGENRVLFGDLLDFSEGLISHALGLTDRKVEFRAVALSFLRTAENYYLANKERY